MKEEWKQFLKDAGANIEHGHVVDFGNPNRERQVVNAGSVITDLSHTGLIAATGDDAQQFLAGQFTNDVLKVSPTLSQLNGYCTPKGRLLALFLVFMREGVFYLDMPREIVTATLQRLRMFVLRAHVTLEEDSDKLVRVGVAGPHADEHLAAVINKIPGHINETCHIDNVTVTRLPGAQPRYHLVGEVADISRIWSALDVNAAPVGAGPWQLLDILAGIPSITETTRETFIPQMVNLDVIDGVSFKKGCYPGQEIVARMRYLGQLKRRMYLARCEADAAPQPGDALYTPENPQKAGVVVSAQAAQDRGFALLAVIEIASAEKELHLKDPQGAPLTLMELPYAVDS